MQIRTWDFTVNAYAPIRIEEIEERYIEAGVRLAEALRGGDWRGVGLRYKSFGNLTLFRFFGDLGDTYFGIKSEKRFRESFRYIAHVAAVELGGVVSNSPELTGERDYTIMVKRTPA